MQFIYVLLCLAILASAAYATRHRRFRETAYLALLQVWSLAGLGAFIGWWISPGRGIQ